MKCDVCHSELPNAEAICRGRLPGAFGLTKLSAGKCGSTKAQREALREKRAAKS